MECLSKNRKKDQLVYFLPLTALEVAGSEIKTKKLKNGRAYPVRVIYLKYLKAYKQQISEFCNDPNNNDKVQGFYERSMQVPMGNDILNLYGTRMRYMFRFLLENMSAVPIKPITKKGAISSSKKVSPSSIRKLGVKSGPGTASVGFMETMMENVEYRMGTIKHAHFMMMQNTTVFKKKGILGAVRKTPPCR